MRNFTLKQLRALSAVTREGTVAGAARELHVTPPAVTMQLRLLEEAAGIPLLDRTGAGFQPTEAGLEVLDAIRRIESTLFECEEALTELRDKGGGRVSVGVVSTAKYFAPRALAAFAVAHPKVDVRLAVGNRSETLTALRDYALDFAIMGRPPEDIEVDSAVFGDHPHVIVGPPDHPLAKRRRIDPDKLSGETFLLREAGSGTRSLMQRLFADAGISPRAGMEIGSNETIKQAVMAGLGIALISAHTVSAEVLDGRLAILDVRGFPVTRQWFVVKRKDKRLLPAGQTLWDFMVSSGEQFLPNVKPMIAPAGKKR